MAHLGTPDDLGRDDPTGRAADRFAVETTIRPSGRGSVATDSRPWEPSSALPTGRVPDTSSAAGTGLGSRRVETRGRRLST